MKYLLILSLAFNAYFLYFLFLEPIGLEPIDYQHTVIADWERDPAFVASMTKLVEEDKKVLGMYLPKYHTIIAPDPKNNWELLTFGHEALHAFNYKHE